MTEEVTTVGPEDTMATAYDLMDERHIRHLPVVDDDQQLVGILSSQDLVKATVAETSDMPLSQKRQLLESMSVEEVMNTAPETVEPTTDLKEAGETLLEFKVGCVPVVDGDRLVGILTESDFVRWFVDSAPSDG